MRLSVCEEQWNGREAFVGESQQRVGGDWRGRGAFICFQGPDVARGKPIGCSLDSSPELAQPSPDYACVNCIQETSFAFSFSQNIVKPGTRGPEGAIHPYWPAIIKRRTDYGMNF